MGLDMYLEKRHYVQNWSHMTASERHEITVKKGGVVVKTIKPERISYVVEQVAYWRKANAIHAWFVKNVQDGRDDCLAYHVDADHLKELLNDVTHALASPGEAAKILPTQSGFFFGSTDYDEGYKDDLTHTKTVLTAVLAEPDADHASYSYRASW